MLRGENKRAQSRLYVLQSASSGPVSARVSNWREPGYTGHKPEVLARAKAVPYETSSESSCHKQGVCVCGGEDSDNAHIQPSKGVNSYTEETENLTQSSAITERPWPHAYKYYDSGRICKIGNLHKSMFSA